MESDKAYEVNRRDFLTIATAAIGAVGVGASAVPFIKAMNPTRDIIAAGVMDIDISGIREGELRVIMWRKQPVFVLKRTKEMIDMTGSMDISNLRDPAKTEERSKRPDMLVCIGICTHLGCIPAWQPNTVPGLDQAGFYCPCHGGKYDTLGRRLDGPPPENLHLVPYEFLNDDKLRIGTKEFAGYSENVRKIAELPKT